jgi:hypothetical protein
MRLVEVTDSKTERQFLEMPLRIYRDHPNWIRPLDQDIKAVFDPKKNKHLEQGKAIRWLLYNNQNEVIGRVAAFVSSRTKHKGIQAGGMGFFECIDDQQAANVLFEACRNWLVQEGKEAMDGPVNLGDRDRWWGLLADGFTEPNYGMFYHPPYYQQLFENYGFQLYFKQYTCWRTTDGELHPAFEEKYQRLMLDPGYAFRHVNASDPEKIAADFLHVYTKAWGSHADIPTMTLDQARKLVKSMKPVMDERLIWFGYYKEEPICFFINLPELNQIFKHVNGNLNWKGKLIFLWHKLRKTNHKMFGVVFGVIPEQQGKGVEAALIVASKPIRETQYRELEMNWVGDFNPKMLAVIRSLGAKIIKTHHTYRYNFDRELPFERYPIIR